MADSLQADDVSSLAHRIGEQLALLCPHVPATEVAELSSRLAFAEAAHAADVTFGQAHAEVPTTAPAGSHVVWLPGSLTSAIVLPSGEEQSRVAAVKTQVLAWARRHGAPLNEVASRGSAALRQAGAALVNAYQARPRVQ